MITKTIVLFSDFYLECQWRENDDEQQTNGGQRVKEVYNWVVHAFKAIPILT